MKKTLLAVLTSIALIAGPIAVAGTANAAPGPYTGTVVVVARATAIKHVFRPGQHPRVRFVVRAEEGAGAPRGAVKIVINSRGVHKVIERRYFGEPRVYRLPKLRGTKAGKRYVVNFKFNSKPAGSIYKNDSNRAVFRVKKR